VPDKEPSALTSDDILLAMNTARTLQASGNLIFGVTKSILDANHHTDSAPISPGYFAIARFTNGTASTTG
jgi:hypothetical protein